MGLSMADTAVIRIDGEQVSGDSGVTRKPAPLLSARNRKIFQVGATHSPSNTYVVILNGVGCLLRSEPSWMVAGIYVDRNCSIRTAELPVSHCRNVCSRR
jgi:hypothetical protein